jgi:hypothetical protein
MRPEAGSVALEIILTLPLLVLLLSLLLNLDSCVSSSWDAQMNARLAAWHHARTGEDMQPGAALSALRLCDPMKSSCEITTRTEHSAMDDVAISAMTLLPGGGRSRWASALSGVTSTCRVHENGRWTAPVDAVFCPGRTGSASDVPVRSSDYESAAIEGIAGGIVDVIL